MSKKIIQAVLLGEEEEEISEELAEIKNFKIKPAEQTIQQVQQQINQKPGLQKTSSSTTAPKAPQQIEKPQQQEYINQQTSNLQAQLLQQGGLKFLSKKDRENKKNQEEQIQKKEEIGKQKETDKIREEYDKFKLKEFKRKQEKEERRRLRKIEEERREARRRRSRSRSYSPDDRRKKQSHEEEEEDDGQIQYVTSNTRARIPLKVLEGTTKEQMAIKMQYLGIKAERKKVLKPSEKFKNIFNFSWDKSEDTSKDYNPLYNNRLDSSLLFGRGERAGYDVTEQRAQAVNYERLVHKYDPNYVQQSIKSNSGPKKESIYEIGVGDHWSKKKLQQMSERDWRIFREDNQIIVKGGRVPIPMREWTEYQLPQFIMDAIHRLKYKTPTPIQMQAIPIGMQRKDLIGVAQTGSGKTCAFLVPLICYLRTLPPIDYERASEGPYGLIMLPTRELATQVAQEFDNLTKNLNLRSFVVVGGRQEEEQMFQLQKGCELIIGTPGRIRFALEKKYLVLEQCSWCILDEADEMIDMGFEPDVKFILDSVKTQLKDANEETSELQEMKSKAGQEIYRVTSLFSATFNDAIERIARNYMRTFCYISIGEPGGGKKEIDQRVEFIGEHGKKQRLQTILSQSEAPIIIFTNEKKGADILAKIVNKWDYKTVVYHGSKTQTQREEAVEGFKSKKYDILIATDLAGRGLHVEGVTLVVNFDAPKALKDFVHRTGRTGRAGKKGTAITFLTAHDEGLFYDLNEYLVKNNYDVPFELSNHEATRNKITAPRNKQVIHANM